MKGLNDPLPLSDSVRDTRNTLELNYPSCSPGGKVADHTYQAYAWCRKGYDTVGAEIRLGSVEASKSKTSIGVTCSAERAVEVKPLWF